MFIAGMVVQFLKTGKDHDHREGKEGQTHIDRQSEIHTFRQTWRSDREMATSGDWDPEKIYRLRQKEMQEERLTTEKTTCVERDREMERKTEVLVINFSAILV